MIANNMAAPACDCDHDRLRAGRWNPDLHRHTFPATRRAIFELLCHCTHRDVGIGVLSPDLLRHVLGFVRVCYT